MILADSHYFDSSKEKNFHLLAGIQQKSLEHFQEAIKDRRNESLRKLRELLKMTKEIHKQEACDFTLERMNSNQSISDGLLEELNSFKMISEEKEQITKMTSKRLNSRLLKSKEKMKGFARKLAVYDWLIWPLMSFKKLDGHTKAEWIIFSKPKGSRCLVTIGQGFTICRNKDGSIVRKFKCSLGGPESMADEAHSVLDCIFDKKNSTFYIMDILIWRDEFLTAEPAESRYKFIHEKILREEDLFLQPKENRFFFAAPTKFSLDKEGFEMAYYATTKYEKDGFLFSLKMGEYHEGSNPSILRWDDSLEKKLKVSNGVDCVLNLNADYQLKTLDGVVLGNLDPMILEKQEIKTKSLVKIKIHQPQIDPQLMDSGKLGLIFSDIEVVGLASRRRALEDSLSKIVYRVVNNGISIGIQDIFKCL